MSELVDRLAGFGAGIDLDSVPPSVVHQARRQLVDTVACVLEGSSHQPIRAMAELVSEQGPCSVLGTRSQMGPMRAAFINASAGAWSDMDGGNRFAGGAHVAVHAIPAALAMAEQTKARGRRLLEAIIYGYEVGARLGVGTKLRPGIHPHGTHSTVGAAAACGLMQDFGTSQLARTIDVATSLTLSTSFQAATEGATVRNAYAGVGASMGVLAADLAKAGFTGEADGLGTTFGNIIGTSFEPVKAGEDLGERWEIERSWFKQHAGARPIHAVLDVLAQLDREARVRPEEVVQVTIQMASTEKFANQNPVNALGAKFSAPYATAAYLVLHESGPQAYSETALSNPLVKDLASRVHMVDDASQTPPGAKVAVELVNGSTLYGSALLPAGEFDNDPLSDDQLNRKFMEFASKSLDPQAAEGLLDGLWSIGDVTDVREVTVLAKPR